MAAGLPLDHLFLARARVARGLTQSALALHIGVPYATYCNWEQGHTRPARNRATLAKMIALASVLDLELSDLIVEHPEQCPRLQLNGELMRRVRLDFAMTPAEAAHDCGLLDVLFYLHWEAGAFDPVGLAYQTRMLVEYIQWSGVSRDELVAALERAPLRPLIAQRPPRAAPFVGRMDEVAHLWRWLETAPPAPRVHALLGSGGRGKTVLLAELLELLGEGPRPFGTLFWSFSANSRIEEFLDTALGYFAPDAPTGTGPPLERLIARLTWEDPRPHLLILDGVEALQAPADTAATPGRFTDPSLYRLLTCLAAGLGRGRALLASRLPFPELDAHQGFAPLALTDFSPEEARELLWRLGQADIPTATGLIDALGTLPMALRQAAALPPERLLPAAEAEDADEDAGELGAADGAEAPALADLLAQGCQHLDDLERDLMRVLASLPQQAGLTTLLDLRLAPDDLAGALAGASTERIGTALQRLDRLGLVTCTDGTRYRLHDLVGAWWRARVPRPVLVDADADLATARRGAGPAGSARAAAADWRWQLALLSLGRGRAQTGRLLGVLRRALAQPSDAGRGPARIAPGTDGEWRAALAELGILPGRPAGTVEPWGGPLHGGTAPSPGLDGARIRTLAGLFEAAVATGRPDHAFEIYQDYLDGYAELGHRRGLLVLGERLLRLLAGVGADRDGVAPPRDLAPAERFRIAMDWGFFRGALGGLAGEAACYRAALAAAADSPLGQAVALRALAYAERQRGRLGAALVACGLALDAARASGRAGQWVCSAALRAGLLHDLGRIDQARAAFRDLEAESDGEPLAAQGGLWQAQLECDLGRIGPCVELGRRVLGDCAALRDPGLTARCHLMLGRALVSQDAEAARGHLEQARPWVEHCGHTELRLRVQELRARISGARGDTRDAFFEAFKGLRLAEDCGHGLLRVRLAVLVLRWALPGRGPAVLRQSCGLLTAALADGAPDDAWGQADGLHWLGLARARLGDARARATLEEALRRRESLGHPQTHETRRALAGV